VSKRRVVVTGLGIVSPVGSDIKTAWAAILAGKSGIKPITRLDATPFATRFAGEVEGFDVSTYITPKEARRAGLVSIVMWFFIVFSGRMIAYNWFDCDRQPQPAVINWAAGCVVEVP